MIFLDFFARLVNATLSAVSLAMLVRMLLPLLTGEEGGKFYTFLACITEPFIAPVRFLLIKFNIYIILFCAENVNVQSMDILPGIGKILYIIHKVGVGI